MNEKTKAGGAPRCSAWIIDGVRTLTVASALVASGGCYVGGLVFWCQYNRSVCCHEYGLNVWSRTLCILFRLLLQALALVFAEGWDSMPLWIGNQKSELFSSVSAGRSQAAVVAAQIAHKRQGAKPNALS